MHSGKAVTLLLIIAILLVLLSLIGWIYLQQPKFGPKLDNSCSKVEYASLHCTDGKFQNLEPTTVLAGDNTTASIILNGILNRPENLRPDIRIPTQKTDLSSLDSQQDLVIWLGHSSYFVQLGGRRILIDPVFSRYASPIPFANEAFEGTNIYSADDFPDIDYLLMTHDHWDHLDYPSIRALRDKVRHVVCGFGVDQYFLHWGYAKEIVHAAEWFTSLTLDSDFTIHILPARHYSGRMFSKNLTLWAGFALETSRRRLLFGGDSGYGQHIAKIRERFESFDLAVLDMGQYDSRWRYIHMTPEEAAQTADELHAKALLPAHVGKFTIAAHSWDEPFERIVKASEGKNYRLMTPKIGEPVDLADEEQTFANWWRQTSAR
jgi:L-ascorbate metabolism protein UlaG (beta-lactamase superfamily)